MNFALLSVEIILGLGGLLLLALGLLRPVEAKRLNYGLASVIVLGLIFMAWGQGGIAESQLEGTYLADGISWFFKLLFLLAAGLVLAGSGRYARENFRAVWQFPPLVMLAVLGMIIMASAADLIVVYIGLELMTVAFYILSAYMHEDLRSYEAGLKYLVLGAVSSAVFLLGLSYLYAMTGNTRIADVGQILMITGQPALILALGLVLSGLGFKISSVPFHMWAPDVYHGAPTPVAALLAVASKAAGFAVLMRILVGIFAAYAHLFVPLLAVLAAATTIFGNLVAIPQTNMKRLLAYSSIAQAGYIMVGLVAGNSSGFKGILFYALVYVFANLGAFTILTRVEAEAGSSEIQALSGLAKRSPFMAAAMTVCLLSLAGIPPLAGFVGKWYLFMGAVEAGYLWLALLGLVMSMISVYYYLSVSKVMYIGEEDIKQRLGFSFSEGLVMWACFLLTMAAGIYPAPLVDIASSALKFMGGSI